MYGNTCIMLLNLVGFERTYIEAPPAFQSLLMYSYLHCTLLKYFSMKQKFRDILERMSQTANISLFKDNITQNCNEKRVRLFKKNQR